MTNKIAVIKTGGKQYKVKQGSIVKIEKLNKEIGENVVFETLMIVDEDGSNLVLGKPSLGEKVEGKVLEQGKSDKINVLKYKNKTRYLRNRGHRQPFTKIEISEIK